MAKSLLTNEGATLSGSEALSQSIADRRVFESIANSAAEKATREVGVETFTCYLCGKLKKHEEFYSSTDKRCKTGITRICKACAKKILYGNVKSGEEPNADNIYEVLPYLDYPWKYSLYKAAVAVRDGLDDGVGEFADNLTLLDSYIMHLMREHSEFESETFTDSEPYGELQVKRADAEAETESFIDEEYEYNRKDVIRMVGYDPFENYPVITDKPRLYALLISMLDEETKNDGMKLSAVIQIVKKLNQAEVINKQIDWFVNDVSNPNKSISIVDKLAGSSKKLMDVANSLAKDNGISVNFNNNKSAGTSTLSGKIKKLNEIGLRDAKINTFDIGSCEGMRQVAEISEAARHKRIGYDENIAAEIRDIKVELVEEAQKERDEYKEITRKVLLENKDLKNYLKSKGLMDEQGRVIDDE